MNTLKRCLATLVALVMAASAFPATAFAETSSDQSKQVSAQEVEVESRLNPETGKQQSVEQKVYDDNELVTVIVELDAPAVMAQYQVSSYAAISEDSSAGQAVSEFLSSEESQQASQQILDGQQSIIDQISALSSNAGVAVASAEDGNGAGVVARWSNLLNGMAVRVPYGILGQIQQLDGVKRAYVEHVYDRPDEQAEVGDAPWYSYSYDKVDVENVWQEGYTGKGLLVAVLDTGLDLKWSYSYDEEGNQTMQVTRTHEAFRNDSFVSGNPADGTDDWELRYTSESLAAFLEDNQLNSTTGADGGQIVYDYNGLYKNLKVPYACDYADGDINVLPTNSDHGTHVAGTIAGYAEDSEGQVAFSGIAPDAQLLIMKVFPDEDGGAAEYSIINALEDTLKLGADVINLSLGSDNGFADDDTVQNDLYKTVENAGIVLMTSAGNSSYSSASNHYGNNPLSSSVDTAMMSSPAIYSSNLSVASLENAIQVQPYLTWKNADGTQNEVKYADPWSVGMKATFADGKEYPVYLVDGVGTYDDYNKASWYNEYSNPNGKTGFALVMRGEISFEEKVQNAQYFSTVVHGERKGILGVLVYDSDANSTELINMSVANTSLSSAFISGKDGAAMADVLKKNGNVNIVVQSEDKASASETDGQMSSFSSWGAGPALELKPEITAPGGNIWSSIIDQINTSDEGYTGSYGMMSGTSMAAPHMSGIAALVRQRVQADSTFAGLSSKQVGEIVNQLMVSTAIPQKDTNGVFYSPRQQGAGLVNAANAVDTPAYLTVEGQPVGKLELKDDPNRTGSYDIKFDIHNISDQDVTYDVNVTLMRPQTEDVESQWGTRTTMMHQDVVIKTVNLGTITSKANETTTFTSNVSLTAEEKATLDSLFTNGVYVEGFVSLTDTAAKAPTLGLSMLAFYGDWTSAPIFDAGIWTDEATDGENVANNESTWGVSLLGSAVINGGTGEILGYYNLGQNPFDSNAVMNQNTYHSENITISPNGDQYFDRVDDYILYQLRDAKVIVVRVTDAETGEVYFSDWTPYITRTLFNSSVGVPVPISAYYYGLIPIWDGTDTQGNPLPSGTQCNYEIIAYGEGEYGDKVLDPESGNYYTNFDGVASGSVVPTFNGHAMDMNGDVIQFPITVDTEAPTLENHTVSVYEENGRVYMTGTVQDADGSLASLEIVPYVTRTYKEGVGDPNYAEVGVDRNNPFLLENFYDPAKKTYTFKADVTEYVRNNEAFPGENDTYNFVWNGNVLLSCGDYGANDRSYAITVNSSQGLVLSQTSAHW